MNEEERGGKESESGKQRRERKDGGEGWKERSGEEREELKGES